jgi:hypothetical protein
MPSMTMNNCLNVRILGFGSIATFIWGLVSWSIGQLFLLGWMGGFLFKDSSERASKQASKQPRQDRIIVDISFFIGVLWGFQIGADWYYYIPFVSVHKCMAYIALTAVFSRGDAVGSVENCYSALDTQFCIRILGFSFYTSSCT